MISAYITLVTLAIVATFLAWFLHFNPEFITLYRSWFMDRVSVDPVDLASGINVARFQPKSWPMGLIFSYIVAVNSFLVLWIYLKNPAAAIISAILFGLYRYQNGLVEARLKEEALDTQAEIALRLLATNYSTTKSLELAIANTAAHIPSPLRDELESVLADYTSGLTILDALGKLPDRVHSRDITVFVKSVLLSEKLGTDTPQVITKVSKRIEDRIDLREELKNESKGQRMTINIFLAALPLGISIIILFFPSALETLRNTPAGNGILVFSIFIEYIAWFFTRGRAIDL